MPKELDNNEQHIMASVAGLSSTGVNRIASVKDDFVCTDMEALDFNLALRRLKGKKLLMDYGTDVKGGAMVHVTPEGWSWIEENRDMLIKVRKTRRVEYMSV